MSKLSYDDEAKLLSRAIDLAIESVKKLPPKGFDDNHINHFVSTYLDYKNKVLNPEPKYKNSKSLAYIENAILTYFQEGTGDAVHFFWKTVNDQNLGFKRKNKLDKILKRQKIKNQIEYDFVIDVLIPYQQEGLLSEADAQKLNQMIARFEKTSV